MKALATMAVTLVTLGGIGECNGFTTSKRAEDIQENVERICGKDRESPPHGGVENIMLMDGSEDDGIVTCHDGTNHYFNG